jgi:2-O-(6-phospho-alpha-D-mannosyl)-D-glycerate hydrolase
MSKLPTTEEPKVFVIPHTHWDREWYATFQQFRIRLVHVMDALLDLLERDPTYTHFNLDAQTIVLQDYLEIRPEKRELIRGMVRDCRLGVGPWYVLPDEFLVSGEALVRNLLLGNRIASEFGHVQKVGYIPDTFGHISQLPQILQGFDISCAMHFRGLNEGNLKSELWWQSPDGSRVLLHHLPTGLGYANASALAENTQEAAYDLRTFAHFATQRASSSVLLALNGVDHLPAREDLPAILESANRIFRGEFYFQQASLENYFDALQKVLENKTLQTVSGELRDVNRTPNRDNRLLPHILSSRIYNKMQNERAQTLLERWAEPWSAFTWLEGEIYPAAFLWKAWEWLLQNHPHDSIGGCSIDAVHSQMETRFAWATEIAGEILNEQLELLTRKIDLSSLKENEAALVVFNSLPWSLERGITVDVDLWDFFLNRLAMKHWEQIAPNDQADAGESAPELFRRRVLQQWYGGPPILPDPNFRGLRIRPLDSGDPIPVQVESIYRSHVLRPLVSGPATERRGVCARISFEAKLPPYGYQAYAVAPLANPNKPVIVAHPHNVLENEHLRIQVAPNGTFGIEEKSTGQVHRDLGYFEDGGDCGDGYNYSYPLENNIDNTLGAAPRISRLMDGPTVQRVRIEYDWLLPTGLDASGQRRSGARIPCLLRVTLSLEQNSPRLDLEVYFENHVQDHRLRMVFPSDINTQVSHSSAQFDVVEHPIRVVPVSDQAWVEDAPSTFPQQDWVDLSDGQRGMCVIVRGLPEYEVLDTERREVAVTLLRAVGYLGAGYDMQTAVIGAGPHIATPEAQIQRCLTFSLSILPHSGTWDQAEVWRQALVFNNPPRAITTGMEKIRLSPPTGNAPARRSFMAVTGRNVVLSTIKKSETDDALVLRMFNPSDEETQASIHLPFFPEAIRLTGMDETSQPVKDSMASEIVQKGNRVQVTLPHKKVVTLRLERK